MMVTTKNDDLDIDFNDLWVHCRVYINIIEYNEYETSAVKFRKYEC